MNKQDSIDDACRNKQFELTQHLLFSGCTVSSGVWIRAYTS